MSLQQWCRDIGSSCPSCTFVDKKAGRESGATGGAGWFGCVALGGRNVAPLFRGKCCPLCGQHRSEAERGGRRRRCEALSAGTPKFIVGLFPLLFAPVLLVMCRFVGGKRTGWTGVGCRDLGAARLRAVPRSQRFRKIPLLAIPLFSIFVLQVFQEKERQWHEFAKSAERDLLAVTISVTPTTVHAGAGCRTFSPFGQR
jgi:hypothetical protein